MNYRHVYMLIIGHAKSEMKNGLRPKNITQRRRDFKNQYFEFHHVLPKSLFPNWKKKESNVVCLTAREHFFCHQLLTKIYPSKEMNFALVSFISYPQKHGCNYRITGREYERLRILRAENFSKFQKGISCPSKGNAAKGKHWYNNGEREMYAFDCPDGFVKGRLKMSEAQREHYNYVRNKNNVGDKISQGLKNRSSDDLEKTYQKWLKSYCGRSDEEKQKQLEKARKTCSKRTDDERKEIRRKQLETMKKRGYVFKSKS